MIEIELINKLKLFPNAQFGDIQSKETEIQSFFKRYSFLKDDQSYYCFQKEYGGYSFFGDYDSFSIYGFDDNITLHIIEGEGEMITPDDFLVIADYSNINKNLSVGYAIDTSFKRKKGIYKNVYINDKESGYKYFCNDFSSFLELVTSKSF
ncbi:hypothetical protein [Aquimarina sp. AU119]|uniref:hypothetical protein n=1 Tax=Aquimarina sp. AU119 TaxID=2108528 RepID=UPI000D685573|nr:hypothetical protein [Aquimarina sp. AU119]